MSDPIVHRPYDLGLGFELSVKSAVRVSAYCLMESRRERLNLLWELEGGEKPVLLVQFDEILVARVIEEAWYSTEECARETQGIDGSFARIVTGSNYPSGGNYLSSMHPHAQSYAFVTDWDCVNVIAQDAPRAKLIEMEEVEEYRFEFPLPQ